MNRMNLNPKEFNLVKRQTGAVIHLAMTPLYHLPYQHFQRVWVPELERMIGFCMDADAPKSLHYASSYNANFFKTEEDFSALNTNAWQSGYAGFKWVANRAILNAMGHGLRGCIYDIPLVLGSERQGICPGHYSIWLILDIFLKTGHFFPFTFRIIPVDILAEIIVFSIVNENEDKFLRPLLSDPVTDRLFSRTAANLLGLKEATLETVREICQNKLRFDFMMPQHFYDLLDKVNSLPPVFPDGYDTGKLPLTPMVFMSNLNRVFARKSETVI
jgi:thioester reductase-like protein